MSRAPYMDELALRLERGLAAFAVPPPQTLDEWARAHYYLGETTYVEQAWTPWPFQSGIMSAISNDDIREVTLKKSARIGYTRILLAAIGYYAHHKRRNQIIWQPTDEDRDEFVKADLDVMLRDVKCMAEVMPTHATSRHKDNTLNLKRFLGSVLYMKGGKAAKNYRRIAAEVAYLDEISAFDRDIEKEGSPYMLAGKRLEGATFPKLVSGSTPKIKGLCQVDERFAAADVRMTYHVRCVHCGELHPLTWGGKDQPHGLKWQGRDPASVMHMCPHCQVLSTQADFLRVHEDGVWVSDDGMMRMDHDGRFSDAEGRPVPPPSHVAFHVWTAYNPTVSWQRIVEEFWRAVDLQAGGKGEALKAFTNLSLGECWEDEVERTDADELRQRAEDYPPRMMPRECLLLLCGGDTQDNRLEFGVWGYGRGGEMWSIDHQVFFGNPALPAVWDEAEEWLRSMTYQHASGVPQSIYATAIDSGGHHADAVYAFAHRLRGLRVHAVKGVAMRERAICNGNTRVGFRWNGRTEKHGPVLWHVGTNLAKDRFHARLDVRVPGPGYVHLCAAMSDEWFRQLAGEQRVLRRVQGGSETRWIPTRQRIEVKDCLTYAIWLEERLDLWSPRRAGFWDQLEAALNPPADPVSTGPAPQHDRGVATTARAPAAPAKSPKRIGQAKRPGNFATSW